MHIFISRNIFSYIYISKKMIYYKANSIANLMRVDKKIQVSQMIDDKKEINFKIVYNIKLCKSSQFIT